MDATMARLLTLLCCLVALPAWGLEKVTLQLNWKHQFQFAGYYAAIEKGYYQQAGFDVRIVEATEGVDPIAKVLQGEAQFGVGASELALHRGRGEPVVALAVILQHSPLVLLAARNRFGTIHELAGRRIMLMPHETELYAYFKREGIHTYQAIPHTFDVKDLVDGRVDALSGYVTDETFSLQQARFPYVALTPRSAGIDFYGDTLYTTETEIDRHASRVKAFREASLKGWHYAMTHTEEIADLIVSRYSDRHSRAHLLFEAREMARLMQPDLVEIGHMAPGRWQHIADTYAELGMIPAGKSMDELIYDAAPHPLPHWVVPILALGSLVGLLLTLAAVRFATLNRRLRESEERYRVLAENSTDVIWTLDIASRRFTYISPSVRRMRGYTPEEVLMMPAEAAMTPESLQRAAASLEEQLGRFTRGDPGAGRGVIELDLLHKDGHVVPTEVVATYIVDKQGHPTTILAVARDITKRRKVEAALRNSEEKFRTLLETAPFPVVITRIADGRVLYINQQATAWFGVPQDAAGGRSARDYYVLPEQRDAMVDQVRRQQLVRDMEVLLRRENGEQRWVLLSVQPIFFDGDPATFTAFNDISERKNAEVALREVNDRMREQLQEIERLRSALQEQAIRDSLTGMFNRRYLDEMLEREIARARREGISLSLVMLDVDHFKALNDTYGHRAGDEALRAIADALRQDIRSEDVPCRYGGEEFLILLPHMPLAAAGERAEQWRLAIDQIRVRFGEFELRLSASFGVAAYPYHGKTADELIHLADVALYAAKRQGRNRVVVYDTSLDALDSLGEPEG